MDNVVIDTSADLEEYICFGFCVLACMGVCYVGSKLIEWMGEWL